MMQLPNTQRSKSATPASIGLCALILMAAAVHIVSGQIRVRTEVVLVPVTVRDANDEFSAELSKDDFTVLEDGRVQEIISFDNEPQPLSAAIVIDDGIGGVSLHRVTAQLSTIAAGINAADEVSVFRYARNVEKLSDFSSDPKEMQKSFERITAIGDTHSEEQQELITGGPGWLRSILGIFPDGSKGTSKNHVLHNAIYEAATALQTRPRERRKVIFIVSDGQASGPANVHSLKDNTDLLTKNEIQVFAVSTAYAKFGSFGTLSSYADATGGEVHSGATDRSLEHAFNQVTEQAHRQYILGYVSTNTSTKPGVFRKIEVRTNQKNLKVTYRKGYVRYTAAK